VPISPADHLGAVRRSLSTVTRDGHELRLLSVERTYDAAPEEVWDALTDAERIPRWFLPVSGDLRPGGRFQLEGNAGGEVLGCDRPERLSITWEHAGGMSWVDLTLRPTDGGTLLRLDHSAPVDPAMWEEFGPGAVGIGWEMGLMGLALHLADPTAARVTEPLPDDLAELMRRSSAAWGEASIAAGTDAASARAAAERCAAAYTARPED
jgi:uncharacterized protein YndB with AHSA1/START domain